MHKEPNEFNFPNHHEIYPKEQLADWEMELLGAAIKPKTDSFLTDTLQKHVLNKPSLSDLNVIQHISPEKLYTSIIPSSHEDLYTNLESEYSPSHVVDWKTNIVPLDETEDYIDHPVSGGFGTTYKPHKFEKFLDRSLDGELDDEFIDYLLEVRPYDLVEEIMSRSPDESVKLWNRLMQHSDAKYTVLSNLHRLPSGVKLPARMLSWAISYDPEAVARMYKRGDVPDVSREEIVQGFIGRGMFNILFREDLASGITLQEMLDISTKAGNVDRIELLQLLPRHGFIKTADDIKILKKYNNVDDKDLEYYILQRHQSREVQSAVFRAVYIDGNETRFLSYHLRSYDELDDDCLEWLIDHISVISDPQEMERFEALFAHGGEAVRNRFWAVHGTAMEGIRQEMAAHKDADKRRSEQLVSEKSYYVNNNLLQHIHHPDEQLSPEQIIDALEYDHVVKEIPAFSEVAGDETRQNKLKAVVDSRRELSTSELGSNPNGTVRTMTEYEALQQYLGFVANDMRQIADINYVSASLEQDISFIGEKEYNEAAKGIALYWKAFLDKGADFQVFVSTTVTARGGYTKSDTYLLDRILSNFTDKELQKYAGQLVLHDGDITQKSPEKVKVVLLDDWTISGAQLRSGYTDFCAAHPELTKSVEIQLMIATRDRLAMGLEEMQTSQVSQHGTYSMTAHDVPTVVRAYYVARQADEVGRSAHEARITGSHSSVDFGFASDIGQYKTPDSNMPALASIVRPYRAKGYKPQNINRLGTASMVKVLQERFNQYV